MWPFYYPIFIHRVDHDLMNKMAELKVLQHKRNEQLKRDVLIAEADRIENIDERIGYLKALRDMID